MKTLKKVLKITGWILLSIITIAVTFYAYASYSVNTRLEKQYDVTTETIIIPTDSTSIVKGEHLVDIKGCRDCHGDDMAGKVIADDIMLGRMAGPNLTRGKGGLPRGYKTENWVKAIRHGLDSNNYPIMVMPSLETSKMTKNDLQAMIAYLENLSPVDNTVPASSLGIVIKNDDPPQRYRYDPRREDRSQSEDGRGGGYIVTDRPWEIFVGDVLWLPP